MSGDRRVGCLGALVRLLGGGRGHDGLPAAVVTADDARYPDVTAGTNRRWQGRPEQVRLATTPWHVLVAVQDAVRADNRISVRSGGNCYEDFVYNDDVDMVIDVSELDEIGYDADRDAISVGAGALLTNVYAALYRIWGVTLPGGSCSTVTAGGHIAGGGFGLLSRRHGLTVDYVHGVEVVTVDGEGRVRIVVATREENDPHRELWWAHTGGGGGNFGVVTRYLLRGPGARDGDPTTFLPRPPAQVLLSTVALDWADVDEVSFTRLLRNFGTWHERNSSPDSEYTGLFALLKLGKRTVDESGRARGQIALVTQADGTGTDSQALLERFLLAVFDGVGSRQQPWAGAQVGELESLPQYFRPRLVPWFQATLQLAGAPVGKRAECKSAYLKTSFTDEQISAAWRWLTTDAYDNPDALLQIDSFGGRINSVAPASTAFPHRGSVLSLQQQAYWSDAEDDETHLTWMRGFYRDMFASTGGVPVPGDDVNTDGCFVNYPDIDLSDPEWNTSDVPWFTLYYKDNYARLQRVKRTYDPGEVFRHAQSVRPA